MAGEWRESTVAEEVDILVGFAFKSAEFATEPPGYRLVRGDNIKRGTIEWGEKTRYWRELTPDLEKYVLRPGDVVVGMDGSRVGENFACVSQEDLPALLVQRVACLRTKGNVDQAYLRYVICNPEFTAYIKAVHTGTSIPHISSGQIGDYRISVPSLPEQRAIAHILGTLDDKIELNRRMSATLEAMARALFKSWFVDFEPVRAKMEGRWQRGQSLPGLPAHLYDLFPDRLVDSELGEIPEGWEVGPLGRFFAVGLGGVWGEDEQSARASVEVRCLRGIDCHDLADGRIPDVPVRWVSPKQAADRRMSDGTILIEGSGSFCGRSMIWRRAYDELLGEPVVYSNFCKRLDPLCTAAQATVCWMMMRQAYRDGLLQSFRTGTAFPNFDVHGALSNMIVTVPPAPVADMFNRLFGLSQRLDLMAQTRALAALRDALVPKLIRGEIRVRDAERFLKERGL